MHADVGAGSGAYVGGRVTAGLPIGAAGQMILLGVGAGWLDAPGEPAAGGLVGLTLLQGAEYPFAVSLQAGLGYVVERDAQDRLRQWDIPLGLGLAWEPLVGGMDLEPWLGVRYHLRHYLAQVGGTESGAWASEPGFSAGVNVTLFQPPVLRRWGLHVALDWMRTGDPFAITIGRPRLPVFSVGVHRCVVQCPL